MVLMGPDDGEQGMGEMWHQENPDLGIDGIDGLMGR